jgi:DNA polymerase III alpha subunit
MYHTNFVHLHVHSHYSLLDGAAPVKGIIDAARRFRMPAIAITDHGNMFGAIELYQYALKDTRTWSSSRLLVLPTAFITSRASILS